MNLALIGYGNARKAFARLVQAKRSVFPFRTTGIHTARHGTACDSGGLPLSPDFGPAASIDEFLDRAQPEIAIEITTFNPETGEPAISQIRAAMADASYDIDGWDYAAKTAALANVLLDARVTPLSVDRRGIGRLTPQRIQDLAKQGKRSPWYRGASAPRPASLRACAPKCWTKPIRSHRSRARQTCSCCTLI